MQDLGNGIAGAARLISERVLAYLPSLIGAVLLLLAGWVLARVLRALTVRAALLLDALLSRTLAPRAAETLRMGRSAGVLGAVVFWVVVLFFITAATQVLGLSIFTDWLGRVIEYLPTLAAGLLIIAVGYIVSGFVADLVRAASTRVAPAQRDVLARLTQAVLMVAAILVGAEQIGIRITFLAIAAGTVFIALAGGMAFAVSLGSRSYVSNLIGAHYMRQAFEVGQHIRVAGHDGRILELNATGFVLECADGRVLLPGRLYHDEAIVLVVMPARDNHATGDG